MTSKRCEASTPSGPTIFTANPPLAPRR